jgi:hypothetical protein
MTTTQDTDWEITKGRNDIVANLGHALAYLESAKRAIETLRSAGDSEYTIGPQGLDAVHWIADAERATRAGLSITRDIASPE